MNIHMKSRVVMRPVIFFFLAIGLVIINLVFCRGVSLAFDGIKSKSAIVIEAETGKILFAKNAEYRLFPASTTKLMTALVALDHLRLAEVVTVSKRAAEAVPSKVRLKEGDRLSVEMLLYAALVQSANDAAIVLAESVSGSVEDFVALMNMKTIEFGLWNSRFVNPNGLPGEGQYVTAYDLAILMKKAINYPVLYDILSTQTVDIWTETGSRISLKNTNKLLWAEENPLRGKTGYTRDAGHCFVGYENSGKKPLIIAVLGAPSRSVLWKESSSLAVIGTKVAGSLAEPVVISDNSRAENGSSKNTNFRKKTMLAKKSRQRNKT